MVIQARGMQYQASVAPLNVEMFTHICCIRALALYTRGALRAVGDVRLAARGADVAAL